MNTSVQTTCSTCHATLPAASAFCTWCGTALQAVTVVDPYQADADGPELPSRRRTHRDDRPAGPAAGLRSAPAPRGGALGAAFDGVTPAGTGRRIGAFLIDSCVVWAIAGSVFLLTNSLVPAALIAIELAAGLVLWEARSGKTVGNSALGVRVARVETPLAPGTGRAVGRAAVMAIGHLVPGVGPLLILVSTAWDSSGRGAGWHDKAARTVVVDVRAMQRETAVEEPPAFRSPVVIAPVVPAVRPEPWPDVATSAVPRVFTPVRPVFEPVDQVAPPAPPVVAPVRQVAPPVRQAPPAPRVPASYVLTLDTGQAMSVTGWGYIGRNPQAADGERCNHVIAIDDPDRSLSRTHVRFGIDSTGFWLEDRGSANGTFIVQADGSSVQVGAGERLTVPAGGTVRLGDRTFTVGPLA